jgi:hypothetical protein
LWLILYNSMLNFFFLVFQRFLVYMCYMLMFNFFNFFFALGFFLFLVMCNVVYGPMLKWFFCFSLFFVVVYDVGYDFILIFFQRFIPFLSCAYGLWSHFDIFFHWFFYYKNSMLRFSFFFFFPKGFLFFLGYVWVTFT